MTDFVKNFDCKNKEHVLWLRDVGQAMAKATSGERVDIEKIVNDNPMDGNTTMKNMMDWAYIHFQLAMKYSNAVLSCDAYLPTPE